MANEFVNSFVNTVGTSNTVVYSPTGSIDYATVIGVTIANRTSSRIEIDLLVEDTDNSITYILKDSQIETGTSIVPIGGEQKLVLLPNQSLLARASSSASADVTVSALEITEE